MTATPRSVSRLWQRGWGIALTTGVALLPAVSRADDAEVIADGRDHFTLLQPRLVNRQLFEQLTAEEQSFRMGKDLGSIATAADADVGSEQTLDGSEQSRFHGFFVFDTFLAVRPLYGFDANLNLALFNPSASDGYRVSSAASPGGALHFYYEHEVKNAGRARIDVWGTDLDTVTLGGGLLMEQWPNEGAMGNLSYEELYFRYFFGGRAFWPSDDLIGYSLGAFDGKAEVMLADWKFQDTGHHSRYIQLSSRWPLLRRPAGSRLQQANSGDPTWSGVLPAHKLQLVAEVGARLPSTSTAAQAVVVQGERFLAAANPYEELRYAMLTRADYIDAWADVRWHLGYQFRWYQQGYGPREILQAPSSTYNLPYREDAYVTNSFEYFANSLFYDQRSHTVMAEASAPLGGHFRIFGEAELIAYTAVDPETPDRLLPTPLLEEPLWYRAGLQLYPWARLPHRLSGSVSNKQVFSAESSITPTTTRFDRGRFVILQMELFL